MAIKKKCRSPALILIYMNMVLLFWIFNHKGPLKQETVSSSSLNIHPNFQWKSLSYFKLNIKDVCFLLMLPRKLLSLPCFSTPSRSSTCFLTLNIFTVIGNCWKWPKDLKPCFMKIWILIHCLILTAMVLFKHQILKIHPSVITSDNFILNKILLR